MSEGKSGGIGILGAGAWGTALAQALSHSPAGEKGGVMLYARNPQQALSINRSGENAAALSGIRLRPNVTASADIAEVAAASAILLAVTPAQTLRQLCVQLTHLAGDVAGKDLILCSKGFEVETGLLQTEIAASLLPGCRLAVLSGPTFALDVARGLPAACTLAAPTMENAARLRGLLGTPLLRLYPCADMTGAQVAGAAKNVIAIAAGITMGRQLGESARAALITRGLAEIARLNAAMGGREETLMEPCGLGDLLLTCSSVQSRNYAFGLALGRSGTAAQAMEECGGRLTEGYFTARALQNLAAELDVDMPVSDAVYRCLYEDLGVADAVGALLSRPLA